MANRPVKTLLSEARTEIKNKNFPLVKRICENILKIDQNNYNALVFSGYAAQEMENNEDAVAAFNMAISQSPSQILAWQGLRAFYEREKPLVHTQELIDVYIKLVEFYKVDSKKQVNTFHQLGLIYFKELNDYSKAVDIFCEALKLDGMKLTSDNFIVWNTLICCLLSHASLSSEDMELLETAIGNLCEGNLKRLPGFENWNFDILEKYFELLLKEQHHAKLLDMARKIMKCDSDNDFVACWQLRAYIGSCVGDHPLILNDLEEIYENISSNKQESLSYALLSKGAQHFVNNNWVDARDNLSLGIQKNSGTCWEGWLLLCWTLEKFYDGMTVEKYALEGLRLIWPSLKELKRKAVKSLFWLSLGKGLMHQATEQSLEKAVSIFTKVAEDDKLKSEAFFLQGVTYLKMGKLIDAEEVLNMMEKSHAIYALQLALKGLLYNERGSLEHAREIFIAVEKLQPENDEWLLQLGRINYRLLDPTTAYDCYLKAAKVNPYNPTTFLLLGHYYRDISKDFRKSFQCYQFAFDLCQNNDEICLALTDIYQRLNDENAYMSFLCRVTCGATAGSHKWAWIRLGLLHLKKENPTDAINAFQSALRSDPHDSECWQCLAEAYLMRGSYTSALKTFTKVLELNPQLLYCLYQIANIKYLLGLYKDAALAFFQIVTLVPNYVPALKGLGESYLAQAYACFQISLCKKALFLCEDALLSVSRAITANAEFACLWKLLGDIFTLAGQLPGDIVKIRVPKVYLVEDAGHSSVVTVLDTLELLKLGERCYLAAVRLTPQNSSLWHDIGCNCFLQAGVLSDLAEKCKCLHFGIAAAKKAISLMPGNSSHWNVLGVIALSPELAANRLAQHALIKAVTVEPNNYVAWSNLGILYLINDNLKLANQSFAMAQSISPSYVNSWLGQALIAEAMNNGETMDLFRHSAIIGNHSEGYIGFASWACSTLVKTSIEHTSPNVDGVDRMTSVLLASDCLFRFTDKIKENPCAFNMLGLLLERQNILQTAQSAFEKALTLVKQSLDTNAINDVRHNYARVLRKLGKIEKSIAEASTIKEAEFYNYCGLATSYFQMNRLEESTSAYTTAIQWLANTEEERSHLLVAMSSVSYQFSGHQEAKTLLFQSFQMKPACVQGLLALSALGILLDDDMLVAAALKELKPYDLDKKFRQDIAHLNVCFSNVKGNLPVTRNVYCKSLHLWPSDWTFWTHLTKHLLKHTSYLELAAHCGNAAYKLCPAPKLEILKLLMLCYLLLGADEKGALVFKSLLHCYPDQKKIH